VITQGAVQSNHARQTAAAARKLGLRCELVFEKRIGGASDAYLNSGNVLLDRLIGASIREVAKGSDMDAELESVAAELRKKGRKPYVIPGGGSNPVGALGYVDCAQELVGQANRQGLVIDHIVHATGSAGTQAGLVVGLKANNCRIPLLGIGVSAGRDAQEDKVFRLAEQTAEYMGVPGIVANSDVVCNSDYVGEGYGIPTDAMNAALLLLARLEGLLFDPVYSGKALAGMIDLIGKGRFADTENIVFIHTGGVAGVFAYVDRLQT
jgi:L-cysteate sulfo-lyase